MDQQTLQDARERLTGQLARVEAAYRVGARAHSQFRSAAEDRLRHVDRRMSELSPRLGYDDAAADAYDRYQNERVKLHRLFALESA